MIISASRRTDIPAFYSPWFINRIRAGYAAVPNPYYPEKISRVSLKPEDVDAIAFSTRNPRPLCPHLSELDERGFQYYFLITILGSPRALDPKSPPLAAALDTFLELSRRIGPERVIWRYDPIIISDQTGIDYHLEQFRSNASALNGATQHCIISYLDDYVKARPRLATLPAKDMHLAQPREVENSIGTLTTGLAQIARETQIAMTSCAEYYDLTSYGSPQASAWTTNWSTGSLANTCPTKKILRCGRSVAALPVAISVCITHACLAAYTATPPKISTSRPKTTAGTILSPYRCWAGLTRPRLHLKGQTLSRDCLTKVLVFNKRREFGSRLLLP